MKGRYLDGDLVPVKTKADREKLVGKSVVYLRGCDIDKSGRGYFFPRYARIEGVHGREFITDTGYITASDVVEMVVRREEI